jgi:hypothetical protein
MANIPLERQIACVEREIKMRRLMYPRWVVQKRGMTQAQCDQEIAVMEAVLETLQGLAGGEVEPVAVGGQQSLF